MGQTGASRPMSTHRMVRALAGEIVEMKVKRSKIRKKAAKIKKSEFVRFLLTAPETEVAQHQTFVLKKNYQTRKTLPTRMKRILKPKETSRNLRPAAADGPRSKKSTTCRS